MNKFIYKNILEEFDNYIDYNYPETIHIDTLLLVADFDYKPSFDYSDLFESNNKIQFNEIYNKVVTRKLCEDIRKRSLVKCFYEKSLKTVEDSDFQDWTCRLNTVQILNTNVEFNNNLDKRVFKDLKKYCSSKTDTLSPLDVSFHFFDMLYAADPFSELLEFLNILFEDKKNENFYSSFTRFYYSDTKEVLRVALDSLKKENKKNIAIFLPIVYVLAKYHEFPYGTKTILEAIKKQTKKIKSDLPSEIDEFPIYETIMEIEPNSEIKNWIIFSSPNHARNLPDTLTMHVPE